MTRGGTASRVARVAALWTVVLLIAALAFVGGRASVLAVSDDLQNTGADATDTVTWTVKEEEIGRTLTFVGEISETTRPGPLANVDGIVTEAGDRRAHSISEGSRLFSVNLRPITAAEGAIPAFRDLAEETRGADVAQLRGFLCRGGWLSQCSGDVFTAAMTKAVKRWQKAVGLPADGKVLTADLMWFPDLPTRVRASKGLTVGASVATSDHPVVLVSGAPELEVRVSRDQAALIPVGAKVRGGGLKGVVAAVQPGTSQEDDASSGDYFTVSVVKGKTGEPICETTKKCATLLGGSAATSVELGIQTVPRQTGAGVPVRAIRTGADSEQYLVLADGTRVPVTVVGTSGGMAIVTGVELGASVQIDGSGDE